MKVLGIGKHDYKTHYIVEISHDEIQNIMNKSTYNDKIPDLKAGEEFNIDAGYDFKKDIESAIRNMQGAYESFSKASYTMQEFIKLLPPTLLVGE